MRERPRHDGANKIALAVSIHAPLRERLNVSVLIQAQFVVSIHAPVRERLSGYDSRLTRYGFQFTLPRGSDFPLVITVSDWGISIHAPLRERLEVKDDICALLAKFQFTFP